MKALLGLVVALSLVSGCEQASVGSNKPTNTQLTEALMKLTDDDTLTASTAGKVSSEDVDTMLARDCGALDGPIDSIDKLGTIVWGKFNKDGKYWAAKVDLEGICMKQTPNCGDNGNQLCPPEKGKLIIKELRVKLNQDDFGEWKAELMP